jgi:DNA (cytosine-5)-methyltransferase 1
MSGLSYVDLFAGAGGLSVGLERAGFNLVHAVEVNEDARATFAHNRDKWSPEDLSGNIRDYQTEAEILEEVGQGSVDLVVGGPPCQGFSEVISPDGSDERNHLFEDFMNWVRVLRPQAALFENVRGIQSTAGGKFLDAVKQSFDNFGYDVTPRVIESSDFGVPQHRHRLLVLATKQEQTQSPFDKYEIEPKAVPGVIDAIGDLPELGSGEVSKEYRCPPQTVIQSDLRGNSESLTSHQAANHSKKLIERISHVPDGGSKDDIPEHLQPSSGYHNSYSRLKSDEPAVAITSNMSKPSSARCVHPFQDRGLTPREGARLQTFPDHYEFLGTLGAIRKQIGNAVPPYLAEAVGYYLREAVFGRDLTAADKERIYRLRCGGMSPEEFGEQRPYLRTHAQQQTLDQI